MCKKILTIILLLVLFATSGFGCKGAMTTEQQAAIKPVTLNFWTIYDDVGQLKEFAKKYQALRPHVKINIRQIRYDEFDKLFTNSLADDVQPDIVSLNVRWLKRYTGRLSTMPTTVKMGRLVAKNSYTEEKDVIIDTMNMPVLRDVRANYIKSIGEDVIISDKVYGLPLAADSLAIYYNRDILDRAGVAEPPKNWEEFMDAVMKTTKFNAAGDIVQSGVALGTSSNIDNSADLLALFMSQSGVKVTQGNYVRFADGLEKANENSPVIKALRFYTDFANPTKKAYSWNEKMGNALDQFARGKVAFYFGYAYDYPGIKSRAPQMNMEILPMFQLNPDSPSNVINYWVQSVVKKSKNQNEAWDFVRFITTQENVKTYTEATFRPSPYRSQIVEQQKNVNLAPFASQVLFAQNWYRGKNVDVATNALKNLVTDYLKPYGEGDPIKRDVKLIINAATLVQQTM